MSLTVAEHLQRRTPIVSDQQAIENPLSGLAVGKVAKAANSYIFDLQHTQDTPTWQRLEQSRQKAICEIIDFLGTTDGNPMVSKFLDAYRTQAQKVG